MTIKHSVLSLKFLAANKRLREQNAENAKCGACKCSTARSCLQTYLLFTICHGAGTRLRVLRAEFGFVWTLSYAVLESGAVAVFGRGRLGLVSVLEQRGQQGGQQVEGGTVVL